MRIAVLMPAYNEGERLVETLRDLAACVVDHEATVFVVDDGSPPPIALGDARPFEKLRIVFARHAINLGQGAALETARRLSLEARWGSFDAWVTMDADGQHRASDAIALADAIARGVDVALGDRFAGGSEVPRARRLVLRLARVFERWTTGLALSDAHNGLRAFSARAIVAIRLRQNRMAHATELTRSISRAPLAVKEVPVSIRYTDATLAKGQSASGAIAILVDLFQGFLFGGPR